MPRENPTKSAFVLIDMEEGFVNPMGGHCIKNALATVPACEKALAAARRKGIPVFFVKRIYRADGSDVEMTRYANWLKGGKPVTPASRGANSAMAPKGLAPLPGDYTIIKPRWSAFFGTELDLILRRLGVRNVILAGTTTPNCIRSTCYDALSLEYNTILIEDCCSSQTEEIQRVNMIDMKNVGAILMTEADFENYDENTVPDMSELVRNEVMNSGDAPEPFGELSGECGWIDRW